jgi:hypothetical protein
LPLFPPQTSANINTPRGREIFPHGLWWSKNQTDDMSVLLVLSKNLDTARPYKQNVRVRHRQTNHKALSRAESLVRMTIWKALIHVLVLIFLNFQIIWREISVYT